MKKITILLIVALLASCSSQVSKIGVDSERGAYTVVGKAQADAGGFMLFGFIPIKHNTRFQRAYDAAVQQQGGDALINMEVSDSWFWAYIGNGYRVQVKGDVIKYKK